MNEAVEKSLNEMVSPETKRLKENIEQLKSQIKLYEEENRTTIFISSFKREGIDKIKNQYQIDFERQGEKYKMKDKAFQEGYCKDIGKDTSRRLLKINEWKMKAEGMDNAELKKTTTDIISGDKKVFEPGYLDILKKSLLTRKLTTSYNAFKEHVTKSELDFPWKHLNEGKDNNAKLKFYNNIKYGQIKLLAKNMDGDLKPFIYNIEEII